MSMKINIKMKNEEEEENEKLSWKECRAINRKIMKRQSWKYKIEMEEARGIMKNMWHENERKYSNQKAWKKSRRENIVKTNEKWKSYRIK